MVVVVTFTITTITVAVDANARTIVQMCATFIIGIVLPPSPSLSSCCAIEMS